MRGKARALLSGVIIAVGTPVFLTSATSNFSYVTALFSLLEVIPVMAVGFAIARFKRNNDQTYGSDAFIVLLFAVTTLSSMIQFPFAHPIYFCYVAPLAILLVSALVSRLHSPSRILLLGARAHSIFACRVYFSSPRYEYYVHSERSRRTNRPIDSPRAGKNSPESSAQYQQLIPFVASVADGGLIVAGPDCPEVDFLAGLKNPTPFILIFLDTRNYRAEVQKLLNQPGFIRAIVINNDPPF